MLSERELQRSDSKTSIVSCDVDGAHFGGVLAPWLRQRRGRTGFGQNLRWERLSQTEVFSPSVVTRS